MYGVLPHVERLSDEELRAVWVNTLAEVDRGERRMETAEGFRDRLLVAGCIRKWKRQLVGIEGEVRRRGWGMRRDAA